MKIVSLEQLKSGDFTSLVKSNFRVWQEGQEPVEMELWEVTVPRLTPAGGARNETYEHFSLTFIGSGNRLLPQGVYWFESGQLGCLELFMVAASRDQRGIHYLVTINRLVK